MRGETAAHRTHLYHLVRAPNRSAQSSPQKRVLRRDFKDGRPDEWKEKRPRTDGWASATDHSEAFDEYYKGQKICPEEVGKAFGWFVVWVGVVYWANGRNV